MHVNKLSEHIKKKCCVSPDITHVSCSVASYNWTIYYVFYLFIYLCCYIKNLISNQLKETITHITSENNKEYCVSKLVSNSHIFALKKLIPTKLVDTCIWNKMSVFLINIHQEHYSNTVWNPALLSDLKSSPHDWFIKVLRTFLWDSGSSWHDYII